MLLIQWKILIFFLVQQNLINALHFKGLDPITQERYKQNLLDNNRKWSCLNDSSIILDINQLNDGICDCPDGSDEPGTAACSDTLEKKLFYCENNGFLPRYISGSLVNDGVCDCCDCSDEMDPSAIKEFDEKFCEKLNDNFQIIIGNELKIFEKGRKKLKKYFDSYSIKLNSDKDNATDNDEDDDINLTLSNINEEIAGLQNDLQNNNNLLNVETKHFMKQLKNFDPLLHKYEQIDLNFIKESVDKIYDKIIKVSQLYEDLNYVMTNLARGYTYTLNDHIVNNNVKDFLNKRKKMDDAKVNIDSKTDIEQKQQLMEYFDIELPNLFWEKKLDHPVEYLINKCQFVKYLVKGKVDSTTEIFAHVDDFIKMMNDIKENHNVNVQDAAVKLSLQQFEQFLSHYGPLLENREIEIDPKYVEEYESLFKLMKKDVSKFHNGNADKDSDGAFGFLSHLKDSLLDSHNSLKSIKSQIDKRQETIKQLKIQIGGKQLEYERFSELQREDNSVEDKRDKYMIKKFTDLLTILPDEERCITNKLNGYIYQICLNPTSEGDVLQQEDKPNGNSVVVGHFNSINFNKELIETKNIDNIKAKYPDDDLLMHLTNSTTAVGKEDYYLAELGSINNGIVINYNRGARCWNGPERAATIFIKCSEEVRINDVHEVTKCNYIFDVEGPWGCNIYGETY